ncbi:hypothetical protein [Parasynechococcus sp.]|uniref:hypothetical protein n=1 Tax=Parasynechococcus sp. TaxID=3101203 RepID=UPI003703FC22
MAIKEKRRHRKGIAKTILIVLIELTTGCGQNDLARRKTKIKPTQKQNGDLQNCAGSNSQQATQRTASIAPQFATSRIQADYWPLLTKLDKRTNICFKLKQQSTIPLFEEQLKTRPIDYAFMNSYHQVIMKSIYLLIIRDEQSLLRGIIVANKESNKSKPNLTILCETKGYPDPVHPFSAHSKLALEEIKNIQGTWLDIASDPKMSNLFDQIQIKRPVKADYDRDYAQLINLGLEKYIQMSRNLKIQIFINKALRIFRHSSIPLRLLPAVD